MREENYDVMEAVVSKEEKKKRTNVFRERERHRKLTTAGLLCCCGLLHECSSFTKTMHVTSLLVVLKFCAAIYIYV
jgi:hypothetical protein